jgi:hypothetical protein
MDDQERDYFLQTIRELERGKRRWQVVALLLLAAFALFLVVGMGSLTLFGLGLERSRTREAMMRAEEARAQAEAARAVAVQAEAALRQLDELKDSKKSEKQNNQKAGAQKP